MTSRAYVDNLLPKLFKEKVIAILARNCSVPTPLKHHCSQLFKMGVSPEEIHALLEFPLLRFEQLENKGHTLKLHSFNWFPENSNEENFMILCAIAIYEGNERRQILRLLKDNLAKNDFDSFVILNSFAKTYFEWYETHPEIGEFTGTKSEDLSAILVEREPRLKDYFQHFFSRPEEDVLKRFFSQEEVEKKTLLQYFDKTPIAICIFKGPNFVIEMANEQYRPYISTSNFTGLTVDQAMPQLRKQGLKSILEKVFSSGRPYQEREMSIHIENGDGNTHHFFDVNFQPILDSTGKVDRILQVAIEVTEQVKIRSELQSTLENVSKLSDSMPQIVFKTDKSGHVVYLNSRWTEYSGSKDPKDWEGHVHPEDLKRVNALWKNSVITGEHFEAEFRLRKASGTYQWHLTRAVPDRNDEGQIMGWYGTSTNIEDQKTLAQKISTANKLVDNERQKFEAIFADAPAAMAILKGPTLIFEKANVGYLKFLGDRDIIGKPLLDAIPELREQPFVDIINEVFKTGISFSSKEALMMLKGVDPEDNSLTAKYFDITYQRMDGPDGLPYGVFIFANDVSEKVFSRQSIQESEKEFKTLAEVMPQIIFTANPNGEITYFNDKWEQYTGFSFEQSKSWTWSPVHHPEDLDNVIAVWKESLSTGKPYQMEYRLRGRDGAFRWFLGRALPIKNQEGRVIKWIGTSTDIHDQKILSQKLESALEQVRYSQQLAQNANEAKSTFLANMSHEIRTPLGAILGFVGLMKNPNLRMEDLQKYISITQRNSEELLKIIDDILDLSKLEAGKLAVEKINVDLESLLLDFNSNMELRAIENGIKFSLEPQTPLPVNVLSDPTRLKQILLNIVGNAIKFTQKGCVELQVAFVDSTLEFTVKDSGAGITPDHAKLLFQPFAQTDSSITRKFGGTGLGLILTQRLCETMEGKFFLKHSEINVGSTFVATVKVSLPHEVKYFSSFKSNLEKDQKKEIDKSALAGVKILVIDDLEDNLMLLNVLLTEAGASVVIESDAFEGIRQALERKFDVILMDIQMPLMNGYDVLKKIRKAGGITPIIALTAHAMKDEREKAINHGFSDFLAKPISSETLVNTINRIHKQNLYVPPPTEKILIVEDDHDLRDLLDVLLTSKGLDVTFMETGEALLNYMATHEAPKLILVDLALPFMSGNELIPILNKRTDRNQYKVIIASGWDDLPSRAKILKADGYLKKPYNPQTIADSIKKLLPNETTLSR